VRIGVVDPRDLRAAAERFGEGDLETRVAERRQDEIGVLASAFNRMAGRIRGTWYCPEPAAAGWSLTNCGASGAAGVRCGAGEDLGRS